MRSEGGGGSGEGHGSREGESRNRRVGVWLTLFGVAAICGLTLFPTGGQPDTPPLCIVCGERSLLDAILNVALFMPLGLGLVMLGKRPAAAALIGLALSVTVELLQATVISGRDPALRDVLTNMLGAYAGAIIGRHLSSILAPSPRAARMLVIAAASAWIALHAAGDWMSFPVLDARYLLPSPPLRTRMYEPFRGQLLASSFNGRSIDAREVKLSDAEVAVSSGRRGRLLARATVLPDERETGRVAPLLMLADPPENVQLVLGQLGSTLVLEVRSRAADLRLRPLAFQMDRAFPGRSGAIGVPGRPLALEAELAPGRIVMSATSDERVRVETGRIGPALVWAFILPFELPVGPYTSAGAILWLVGSLLPLGYWIGWAGPSSRPRRVAGVLALILSLAVITLVVLPALFRVSYGTWGEWAAVAFGISAGALIGARREKAGAEAVRE